MKSKIEKIHTLLLRSQYAAAEHELEQLLEGFDDMATRARIAPMLYEQNQKLNEQIEVLEASNRIKAANVENLEKELAELKLHKEYDQTLDALIAERDALLAEREAMMKQEPIYQIYSHDQHKWGDICAESYERNKEAGHTVRKLYPLPAQQIPEGYALEEKNKSIRDLLEALRKQRAAIPDTIEYEPIGANHDENTAHQGYCSGWNDCVAAMLSASQPKGDV